MTCTSATDVIIDGDFKFISSPRTEMLTYPATSKLIIKCWEFKGLGNCTGTARAFACLDTGFCEPIELQRQDGRGDIELYSVDRALVNWTLTFDNSLLSTSCFPRRVAATSVYSIDTDDSSPEIIFPILLIFVIVLLLVICAFSGRRFTKYLAPRIVHFYKEEQSAIHEQKMTVVQQTEPPQFNMPVPGGSISSPPKGGGYSYMV